MAKKSKQEWKKEGETLKKLFADAKKKPHSFALLWAKEGMILEASFKYDADKMWKEAKKNKDSSAKGAKGELKVQGTEIIFKLSEEAPGGVDTRFKQYLALCGVKMRPVFENPAEGDAKKGQPAAEEEAASKPGPQAQTEEHAEAKAPKPSQEEAESAQKSTEEQQAQDDQSAEDGDQEEKPKSHSGEVPPLEELKAAFEHVSGIFDLSLEGVEEAEAKPFRDAIKTCGAALSSGDDTTVNNILNKLGLLYGITKDSPMVAHDLKLGGGGDVDKKSLAKDFKKMKPALDDVIDNAEGAEKSKLKKVTANFAKSLKADKLEDVQKIYEALKKKVESFEPKANGEDADEDDDLSPEARGQRESELDDLEASIDALIADLGGMEALRQTDGI